MTDQLRRVPPGPAEGYDPAEDLLAWLRTQFAAFGDVFKSSAYGFDLYGVNHPAYLQHILRTNWQNYRRGFAIKRIEMLLGRGLVVSEGEFWKAQRKMIQPAFHRQAIGALKPMVVAANLDLCDAWVAAAREGRSINITRDISVMVLKTVLIAIFGRDYDAVAADFHLLSDETARDLRFAQAFRRLGDAVVRIVRLRRQQGRAEADILGTMMQAREAETGSPMSDRQLIDEVLTLLVAGHETTASTLNFAWYLLSQHPEAARRLEIEADETGEDLLPGLEELPRFPYSRQVVDETLRLYPALWLMTRRALNDDYLGDYFVPAGTEVYISSYFMQRHPNFWPDPDRFDPDRFAPERVRERPELAMIPFSAGPRNCIGEVLARLELQLHLLIVARRLRLRFSGGDRVGQPPELEIGVNLRSKHDFTMLAERRDRGS